MSVKRAVTSYLYLIYNSKNVIFTYSDMGSRHLILYKKMHIFMQYRIKQTLIFSAI